MTTPHRVLAAAAVLAIAFSASMLAQAPALNVNMGLWEITSVSEIGGQMPGFDTSRMTAEQKAQMAEAMKALMGKHTDTSKSCVTKEDFNSRNFLTGSDDDDCTQTLTTNSRTTLEGTVVCTGDSKSTSQMHVDALSATSFKGTFKSTSTAEGRTMTMDITMTGRWLGADCGSLK